MIYCVRHAQGVAYLRELHFDLMGRTDEAELYAAGDRVISIRRPNVNGDVPENLVADAFDAAGLPLPPWNVHWCD